MPIRATYRKVEISEAERLLAKQERNRPVKAHWVNRLAETMRDGEWYSETGESIKISRKGALLDGQHRLEALVLYGKPLMFLVVSGIDPAAQEFMDQVRARSAADDLAMHGYHNSNSLAAVSRLLLLHEAGILPGAGGTRGNNKGGTFFQPKTIRMYVERNADTVEHTKIAASQRGAMVPFTPTLNAFLRVVFHRLDSKAAAVFMDMAVGGGGGAKTKHPAFLLNRMLLKEKLDKNIHYSAIRRIGFAFKAWNLFGQGERRHVIALKANENWPEPLRPTSPLITKAA